MDGNLRKIFRAKIPLAHWQSIETGLTGKGIPDSNACFDGVEIWLECKKANHWQVRIWPEQVAWLERRHRAGGRAFVGVRRITKATRKEPALDQLWLLTAHAARHLATPGSGGLKELPAACLLGCWEGGPARWPWENIAKTLFSRA